MILDRPAYRVSEVLWMLGIGKSTFWTWAKNEKIRTARIGGAVFVPADELNRLLATEKTAA